MKIKLPGLWMVRCLWIICFLIGISIGQRVKGGSQSYQQSSQRFSEYQSGGTAYGTQEASNWPCIKPEEFRNGRRSCSITNDRYACTGVCDPGYKFPNGKDELVLDCSRQTGHWMPYRKFECIGSGGYGQNSYQQSHGSGYGQSSSVSQGSYSRSFSHSSSGQASNAAQNSYGGGSSYTQHSSTQGHSTGLCGSTPNSPSHGNLSCSMSNEKWTCIFTCLPGYKFADGNSQATHICYEKDGYWFPKKEFDDCIGSGGGSSGRQYSQQRVSSSSYSSSGQYGHGGGSNYGQQSSMQGYGQGLCGQPASLRRGSQSCGNVNGQVTCRAACPPGYQFPDGTNQTTHTCNDRDGRWLPKKDFDECIYIGGSSYGQSTSQQHFGQGLCGQPASLRRGSQSCGNANGQVTCRAACPPGYQFPDGTNQTTHTCHDRDGRWLPKKDFDECIYVGGASYGQSTSQQNMGGSSYGHSSSQQTSYGGGSYSRQHSSQQSQSSGLCGSPRNPIYGFHSCSMSANKWTCQITCNPGYEFSDGSRQVITTCNERDGRWSPKMDFGDCRLLCHPPCQNGGQCALHNTCQCPPTHRGNRCQYATSLCDFNRLSSSVYAACEHFPEYSECKISCPAGMTFDPLSSSVYRCTVDGLWNPPRAPTCKIDSLCEKPPLPMHGNVSCTGNHEIMICSGICLPGYAFENGFSELSLQCVIRTGEWTPDQGFPDCEPICSPECMHGGKCIGHNSCLCTKEYRGPRCEYPSDNCDIHERLASVARACEITSEEIICNVSCGDTPGILQPPQPTVYICRVDGTWQPDLKPICVTDYSLIDARNRQQHGGYQSHETRSGVQQNRGSTSQRVNSRQQNLGGYENYGVQQQVDYDEYEEQQQQQQQTHNFGGQQQVDYEFGGQQPVDYDFGGQQQVDYEFGHNAYSNNQVGEIPAQKVESYETHQTHGGNSRVSHEVSNDRQKQGLEDFDVDLPDQTEVQDEFEETYRLTDEDAQEIMDEIGDDNEVNSEFSIFSEKRMVSTYHGICTTWGFFHYRTFNGEVYTFPSTCWYLLAASTTDDFAISIRSDCSGDTVCLRVVSVQLANYKYLLSYSDGLMRNGVELQIPIQDENLVVEYISRYLVAKTQFGYTIWINEENTVLLVAEPYVQNKTKGMCGNYDGTPDALFLASDGSKTPDIFTFTTSWKMENIDGVCVDEAELKQPCTSESREKRMEADKSNLACAAFLDIEFHKCTQVLNLEVYYRQCQMDCCNMGAEESCQCTSMGEFVLECSRAGVDMNKGWRQPGLCPLGCTNGSVYNECGPACPPTCRDLQPVCNFQKCVDGCHCPTGTVLEKGQCISKDLCPCHYGSEHFDSGETIQQDCNACVCQGGNWKCTDSICPATCSIAGPHFTTFDGFPYDFQGKCSYYLVDSDDFNIRLDYGTNCKEKTSGVCIKGITIHTPEEAVVKLKPSMDVTVNGREMESLPIKAPGIYIGQSTSSFMRAQLKNGLEILWDLGPNIQVFAPVELFDSLKGLCGTFTKNQQDEFLTPEGDIETSAGSFTQKWRVEETCRDVEDPIDSEGGEKACDRYSERRETAIEVCNVLKGPAFEGCHDLLDYERYFSDCMEDVCSCEDEPVTCTCLSLANYAYACARKGKPLSWRPSVPACGIACPLGLVYVSCADPCSYTCNEIANVPTECRESCVEGCVCPPGKALNEHGQCVYMSSCSCVHSGHFYPPEFLQRRGKEMCECSQGHWDCYEATAADLILTPPTNIAMECDRSAHLMPTDCMTDCPLTCTNYLHHQPCTVAACHPGCMCQNGYVLDATSGACVEPYNCPCHHGGKSYEEGEEVKMDCNKCVCEGGSWNCDSHSCPGLCSAWGDSHFETFDGNLYDFEGTCEYVLVKARINDNEFFSVIFQNVPCGMGSEATCGKAISVTLGGTSISLTRLHPLPSLPENSRLTVTPIGMFTLVESDIGISVQWDRNTRVYVTAQPIWKNKMQGLCGDFNGDASDDFRSPSGGMPLVLAKDFADSWRVHKFCPRAKHPDDACGRNPERRTWARHKCSVLKTDLFKPCHYQVEVEDYYKRCVTDACACNLGGDCECVCAVIGAYAQKCARRGVVIPWRSQEVCPVQCDTCDRYSPCISLCPPVNCDTYLIPLEQQSCSREHCVDGCAPKPCKPGYIHKSATNLTCIPEDMCDDKPCIEIDGVAYREGERIEREDVGDACQSCYCRNGEVECLGVPCTYSTMEPFISTIAPQACEFTGWTDWINTRDPEDNEGRDYENLDELALTHRIPCPLDHVRSIECRSAATQEPAEATGQDVTCSIQQGLKCRKTVYASECMDYEVRVFCQCHEEATCPPEQEWEECAFDCENSCQSLVADLQQNSLCVEEKCAPGCVKTPCQLPLVARDAETCVKPEQCTCKLDSGFIVAPGQVITNGCEKCQCMNNTLICSTTLECQQTLAPEIKSQIKPERFEVTTVKPKTKTSRPRGGISGLGGGGIALTTPACSFWSHWINKSKPKNGKKAKEREDTRAYILQQTEGFCQEGTITTIECREVETDLDYTQTNQEKLVCSLNVGFVCKNRFQPDGRCKDYKIRYLCSCSEATTPVPIFIKTTTPAYTYPCSDFVPLIDGPHPLPDTSLKASSSRSSLTGPDAARFKNYETRKSWTPEDSNEKQFIEIDLGQVRGVYGIITKGKDSSKEWVSSYQLLYSKNGNSYSYYQDEADKNKVFSGNFDGTTEVKHLFKPPFEAKLVRLEPLTWVGKISLRLELLGCSEALTTLSPEEEEEEGRILPIHIPTTTPAPIAECLEPMGLENGALMDSQLSASSSYSSTLTPENVRLGSDSVWSVAYSDDKQYLQIDFLDEANVTGIITKGREDEPQWVTAYTVSYSNDGIIWNKIKDEDDEDSLKEFAANYDSFSVVSNELPATIRTRFLRIHPTKWKDWISMQIEILGCYRPLPCRDPMGIDEGVILNYQLTSSSELSKSKAAPHGRLSSLSSWTPSKDDKHQFLQVDLLEPVKVTGIITKGDPELQQWVKSYNVAYSNDSIDWKKTQNVHGKVKEFHGNNDQDSPVINLLPISIISRYIRIIPVKWHRWTSLRVSLLGCVKEQVCREPMGLENNVLPDAQITASSTLDWTSSPSHARISDPSGWVASPYDSTPYLQVDFREPRNVSAVVTKGVGTNDFWVNKFKVLHSDNADKWLPITDDYGDIIEYQGNDDSDTPVINTFPEPVEDRYFRLVPLSYNNKPGLRLELLGCYHPYVCQEPLGMESGTIYDFQITASSSLNPELYPVNARLDSDTAWAPKLDDSDPYIQVDLIVPTNITGVMTRGRNDANEWVKTYEIEFSDNGLEWKSQETGYVVEHKGNTDNESPVTNLFPEPMFSRFIRIKPTSSERKIGLRFEILGCFEEKVCMEPMGIESGLMPEGQISASSSKTEILNPEIIRLNSEIGWSVSTVEVPQFLQVDFGEPRNLSAVVIQGSPEEPEWVTAFLVTHSNDEEEWQPVTNDKDEPVEFPGNVDNDTPVISVFPETIEAQYIRIIPTDWKKWISLRLEILGCYHPYEPVVTTPLPDYVLPEMQIPTEPSMEFLCPNSFEPESSLLEDATIQASSSTLEGAPSRLPLDTRGEPGRSGGWVPRVDDLHPHLTIELPEVKWLTSIYIQGREDEENWVKTFRVVGSEDNKKWLPVFGPDGHEVIEGNSDQTGIVSHFFKTPMEVKYIKIIPETWHKWPSFRLELKGCEITEEESTISPITEVLKLCPELLDEPDLADNCPVFCPPGMMCNGNECVDPLDCPCVHERVVFPVSDRIVDTSCKQCDCVLGGRSICTEKACPSCAEDERSVLDDDCTCTCKACESNQKMCPTTHECIPKQRWCDGIIDCEDDEVNCIYTSTETTTEVSTIPPEPENATCDVMGKHIKTFDGQDISYEICHHTVMKDIVNGLYKVTLHKDCNAKDDCKHWMELKHMNQNIKVFSDLRVEFNGHSYTASQLPKLRKKSSGNLLIQRVGDQVIIKSHNEGYTVIYDNKGHLKIEVTPTLMNRLGGLCGFYSGEPEDDQKKPDGKRAYTSEEFGDSWTVDENGADCIPLICPHDIMARALLQCQKLRNEPFKECGKVLSVDLFIEFCMSSTCECIQHKNSSDEKCKCDAFQTYAEACEDKLGPAAAVRNWRFMHECHSECPAGLEWNDCGPSCQLTCDSSSETTLQQCSEKCVPGCFCPPGTVLNEDRCVLPEQCADQLCQGFGDPHFRTFDGDFFVFLAEGTYLIVGDKENDFALFGVSRRCSFFTHNTCLIGLEVVYKGHKVTMKKDREVHIDGISIPMDKLPIHSHGMIVLGYPGATYIVSIPLMSLEARFYEENSGFAVKVPSRRYFNKTEGICGNCNGKKDELEDKPLSEFVCSFQVEGELDECEKSMEELPKLPERIPICERLEDPVFEACHPLVDIDIYIEACSFDAIHSEKDKESFCKTAKEYARQCCQAGVDIEDWPEILGCDITCSEDFAYHQCHEGCPQTCSSVKNASKDSTCDQLKTDGCFCPDDKILKDGSCVDAVLCDTCDDEGHVAGDKWKEGKCKSCYCRHDLTIECQVEKCPSNPICAIDETLAKIDRESEECCESFACIPKIENCPAPVVPECPKGEAAKIRTTKGLCTEFECECDPALCPPIVWPDLEEGQLTEIVEDSCCQRVRVVCDRSSCSEKPDCPKELELLEIEGECCSTYKCKPREDVCVYINKYEIEDGFQVPLISVDATPSLYKPGDEWEDGLCEKCSCVETKNSQPTAVCTVDGCTPMEESRDYVLQEVKVPGKCCPEIVRKLCKDDDGNVYEVGQQWSDPDDACIKYVCEDRGGGEIEKTKSVINCTECPRTAMYFPPSKILGQCCGICRVTKCEDDDQLYEVGDTWVNPDQPCREAECIKEHDAVKTVYTKKPCPVVPKDCPEDQIIPDEDGCCKTCNITSEIRCNSAPIPEKDTVGFFKYEDEDRGGTCVNEQTVPNVLKCSGACHSESYYSLEDGDFKDTCKCCKVNITVDRTIDLICPDGSYIKKTFLQPETCQCSKCAPKSGSETEKVQTKQTFGPWEESQVEDKSDIGTFTNFQREKEKLPFQQLDLDRQVQQEQKDYDTFGQDMQQQQEDYDDIFDRLEQRSD